MTEKAKIIAGLLEQVAWWIHELAGSRDLVGDVYLDGGPAANPGLATAVEDERLRDIRVLAHPQFTVAYGAAVAFAQLSFAC